ncbi:MAG: T9SS type A sorting domain-containing protein [Melioribacteraceae bacterium]|nr:T9SS type A sorting domain-containing protein [Melioribacteraceae bacterium]
MKFKILIFTLLLPIIFSAQVITWNPVYLTEDDSVTIIFNAAEGNKGLENYNTDDVYAHAGVITDASTGPSDWQHAPAWGDNSPKYKLKFIGNNLYELKITPSIKEFYGLNESEQAINLAFVFRNAAPDREGKDVNNADIFLPLRSGFSVLSPAKEVTFLNPNQTINIKISKSEIIDSLQLIINNTKAFSTSEDTLSYDYKTIEFGIKNFKVIGFSNNDTLQVKTFQIVLNQANVVEELPAGITHGINYNTDNSVTLALMAPSKNFVYLIGDFNDWQLESGYRMKKTPDDSTYWITLNNIDPDTEYGFQYLVDGNLRIADPYTEKVLDQNNDKWISEATYPNLKKFPQGKTTGIVSTFLVNEYEYNFEVKTFEKPKIEDLVVYELLVRDFVSTHSYRTLIDTLSYLEKLGINAIELMPINEFEGNESWGYNPSFYFAADKYYGTRNDLKEFIDECHKRGIAVIIDMVLNHSYDQSPFAQLYWDTQNSRPAANNPWYNTVSPNQSYSWGNDFNHESPYTKKLVDRVNSYWINEFMVDGFRFDFTKGFTQKPGDGWSYDASRISILKRMADKIWEEDPNSYIILEHLAENSEENELSNYGIMLWGNLNHNYNEATMGYNTGSGSNFNGVSYKSRGWSYPNLVGYMESHDEERLMFKNLEYGNSNGAYDIQTLNIALQRIKLASAFFFTIPGPKMIWQFGELGYDYSIDYNGRIGNKPIKWDYLEDINRKRLYQTMSALIKLKTENEVFTTDNFELSLSGETKKISLSHSSMALLVLGNFGVTENTIDPGFRYGGTWYDFFANDSISVSDTHGLITLAAGEFKIYTTKKLAATDPDIILDVEEIENSELPDNYSLKQNYPNPFNPATVIEYSIPSAATRGGESVQLKVYDILGNEIAMLVNKVQSAGSYKVEFDTSRYNLASGIYFYQIQCGSFVNTKKMMLLK